MPQDPNDQFPRPAWNQAVLFTGTDLFGLLRILHKNGWRVRPAYLFDCLIDLGFSVGHTTLRGVQSILYRSRLQNLELEQDPLFVVGHWRTGTTFVHELLSLDPRHTCPTTFQCFVPNHFLLSERFLKSWSGFVLPPNRPPDQMKMGWDLPQEDEFALCNLGVPSPYTTIAFPNHPPRDQEYLELDAISPPQLDRWKRTLRQFVKQVYYRQPGRVVLKSPTHTFRLPVLLEMFPRAQFVYMVRHPVEVFMSTVRLWKSLYATHSYQKPTFAGVEQYVFATFVRMFERWEATRALIPPGNLVEVRYEDLVREPITQVQAIYEQLGLGPFDDVRPAIEDYLADRADYQPNRYEPTPERKDEIFHRWRPYFERYGYAP